MLVATGFDGLEKLWQCTGGGVHIHIRRTRPDRLQHLGEASVSGVDPLGGTRDDIIFGERPG